MVEAARQLLAEGQPATVEAAATRAGVSRATAYRYFTNQSELVLAAHPEIEAASLLPVDAPRDPLRRVDLVAREVMRLTIDWEFELRASLRLSLEPAGAGRELVLRKGRRLMWFEDALVPARRSLGSRRVRRLATALAATAGIEPFVWLTDMAGLSKPDAADLLVWTATSIAASELGEPRT